jgi:hypothetical protein
VIEPPLTRGKSLKEDEDRAKYQGKALEYGTDRVRGVRRPGYQIEQEEADDQENYEPLDPCHVGLLFLAVFTAEYSNSLLPVQASMRSFFSGSRQEASQRALILRLR